MKRVVADPKRCMACRACEFACALAHADTDDLYAALFEQSEKPRIYIEGAGGLAVPLQCRHCEDAPCVRVCPSGALSRPNAAEPVVVRQEKCIGCAYCVQACPFGVVQVSGDKNIVIKCDLCAKRQAAGLEPACVTACPVSALAFEEVEQGARKARARTAAQAAAALRDGGG